jgi:hypothetical protein
MLPNLLENRLTPYAFISVVEVGGAGLMPPAKSLALLETLTPARPVFFQFLVVSSGLNANPTG